MFVVVGYLLALCVIPFILQELFELGYSFLLIQRLMYFWKNFNEIAVLQRSPKHINWFNLSYHKENKTPNNKQKVQKKPKNYQSMRRI